MNLNASKSCSTSSTVKEKMPKVCFVCIIYQRVMITPLSLRGGVLCRIWRAIQRHRERERLRGDERSEDDA